MRRLEKSGPVTLYGGDQYDASTLEINYYIKRLCESYAKIAQLEEICRIWLGSEHTTKFLIEQNSPSTNPLAQSSKKGTPTNVLSKPEKDITHRINLPSEKGGFDMSALTQKAGVTSNFKDISGLDLPVKKRLSVTSVLFNLNDENDARQFFDHFRKIQRPVVYYKQHMDEPVLLFDHFGGDALKLSHLSYNSPLEAVVDGIIKIVDVLLSQECQREAHKLESMLKNQEYLAMNLRLCEQIVHTWQLLNDPTTSYPVKQYVLQQLLMTIDAQARLNASMGISHGLDARV